MTLNTRQKITKEEAYKKLNENPELRYARILDPVSDKKLYGFGARKALAGVLSKLPFDRQKSETEIKSEVNKIVKNLGNISEAKIKEIERDVRIGTKSWSNIKNDMSQRLKGERARNVIASRYSYEREASRAQGEEAVKKALTKSSDSDNVKIDHTRITKGQTYGISALGNNFSQDDFSAPRASVQSGKEAQGVASGIGANKKVGINAPLNNTNLKGNKPIGF